MLARTLRRQPRKEGMGMLRILDRIRLVRLFLAVVALALVGAITPSASAAVFNVKDYGATGDPAGEDSASIQNAINAAFNAGGPQTVLFPPGKYMIAQRIVLKSRVSLQGSGRASTIKAHASFCTAVKKNAGLCQNSMLGFHSYSDPVVNDMSIRFLQIDGSKTTNLLGSGIFVAGSNVTIEGCTIFDTPQAGIVIGTNGAQVCQNVRVLNNWVHNPSPYVDPWGAYAVTGCKPPSPINVAVIFRGNFASTDDGNMSYGITLEPHSNFGQTIQNVVIENNTLKGGFIAVSGDPAAYVKDVAILANQIDVSPANGVPEGIRVDGATGSILVSNNFIRAHTHSSPGIRLRNVSNPTVQANFITGIGVAQDSHPLNVGILVDHVTGGTISNNSIVALQQTHPVMVAGIKSVNGTSGVTYSGNYFQRITCPMQNCP
jgi:hypothetical protein